MKKFELPKEWELNQEAPALTGGHLLHLDGQCFASEHGVLGVALEPGSFEALHRKGSPTHWLIPIESTALAAAAADLSGEVLWLSSRPPAEVVGHLADDFRGAWLEGGEIVFNLGGEVQRLKIAHPPHRSFAAAYLARMVVQVWQAGSDEPVLDSHLDSALASQMIAA